MLQVNNSLFQTCHNKVGRRSANTTYLQLMSTTCLHTCNNFCISCVYQLICGLGHALRYSHGLAIGQEHIILTTFNKLIYGSDITMKIGLRLLRLIESWYNIVARLTIQGCNILVIAYMKPCIIEIYYTKFENSSTLYFPYFSELYNQILLISQCSL